MFQRAHRCIVLPPELARFEHLDDRFGDRILDPFHARGRDLADENVAETVQRQARQRIRFAEHEPVIRFRVEPLAQRERDVETMHDQRAIERMLEAPHDEPRGDQRMRIDIAQADRLAVVIDDRAHFAGLESGERRARDIDFVREHPKMTRAQARIFAAPQVQRRIFDFVGHESSNQRRTRTVAALG